jgi:hypothetical protein
METRSPCLAVRGSVVVVLLAVWLSAAAAPAAGADLLLTGSQHADVTTDYTVGTLYDVSTANVLAGGYIGGVSVKDEALLRVMRPSGTAVGGAHVDDAGRVDISSGWVEFLDAYRGSRVAISGGGVERLGLCGTSDAIIFGGSVGRLDAPGHSNVAISGGSVGELRTGSNSAVTISGGRIDQLRAYDRSSITIHGYDFQATAGLSLVGDQVLGTGLLTGKWFDGTAWTIPIDYQGSRATILAIPEPATLALLAMGLGLLALRRR